MRNKNEIQDSYNKFEKVLNDKKLSTYQVAKETNIACATFSAWKKNQYEPNGRAMFKIANYLEVPISYFYE